MKNSFPFVDLGKADRVLRNPDGQLFFGFDDDQGFTTYFNENGDIDCMLPTPKPWGWRLDND